MTIIVKLKNYSEFYNKLFLRYLGDDVRLDCKNLSYYNENVYYWHNSIKYRLCRIIINDNNTINIKANYRDKSYFDKGNYINKGYKIAYNKLIDFVNNTDIIENIDINYNPLEIDEILTIVKIKFTCPITLLDYDEGYKTICNHVFEKESIVKWIEENRNCPMCRTEIN